MSVARRDTGTKPGPQPTGTNIEDFPLITGLDLRAEPGDMQTMDGWTCPTKLFLYGRGCPLRSRTIDESTRRMRPTRNRLPARAPEKPARAPSSGRQPANPRLDMTRSHVLPGTSDDRALVIDRCRDR